MTRAGGSGQLGPSLVLAAVASLAAGCGTTGGAGHDLPGVDARAARGRSRRRSARRGPRSSARSARSNLVLRDVGDARTARPRRRLLATRRGPSTRSILPEDPDKGFIVVYEFPDPGRGRGGRRRAAGRTSRPGPAGSRRRRDGPRHPQVGSTVVFYDWLPEGVARTRGARASRRARDARGRATPSRADGSAARRPAAAVSAATQARTGSRLTLSVCVRGKSSSGQSRQPAIRWFGPRRRVGGLDRGIDRRGAPDRARLGGASPATAAEPRTIASIRPGCVSSDDRVADARRSRSAFSMSSG